jgi:ABC-type Fe3+-hydroxamate transport system substrate-binding protein
MTRRALGALAAGSRWRSLWARSRLPRDRDADGTGRVAARPRRIVSLVPGVTEMLFAIGAEGHLVGRTDFCDFPPSARAKPSVGGMVAPSLELLVSLKPDLVIVTSSATADGRCSSSGSASRCTSSTRTDSPTSSAPWSASAT